MSDVVHCCAELAEWLADPDLPVIYIPRFREYNIERRRSESQQRIAYCPCCGRKLPISLRDQWFAELEHLGTEPCLYMDEVINLPQEFRTSARWQRRGIP